MEHELEHVSNDCEADNQAKQAETASHPYASNGREAEGAGPGASELAAKREQEKRTLALMVGIYCKGNKHEGRAAEGPGPHGAGICPRCQELVDYCFARIDSCPHMETKTFCSACETHCYKKDMRERIRQVMAYAGPRMLAYDPAGAMRHLRYGRPRKNRS